MDRLVMYSDFMLATVVQVLLDGFETVCPAHKRVCSQAISKTCARR